METRKYYEAYDDRYRQIHALELEWFSNVASPIVPDVINRFGIWKTDRILEIGCGEGRDAVSLLESGYQVLATDISGEAIRFCQEKYIQYHEHFQIHDCIKDRLADRFAFIYAVAVVHMLVEDADRDGFYRFIREQLSEEGIALICSMGDGRMARESDINTAFTLQNRIHEQSGRVVQTAGTSCRMVTFETLHEELNRNGLRVLEEGITAIEPDFPQMMYAVVKRAT